MSMNRNVPLSLSADRPEPLRSRLLGRYGPAAQELLTTAEPGELERSPGLQVTWAEIRWAARNEAVQHPDDLLLRRVRLGLLAPRGAESLLPAVRAICQPELGWNDVRWQAEEARLSKNLEPQLQRSRRTAFSSEPRLTTP